MGKGNGESECKVLIDGFVLITWFLSPGVLFVRVSGHTLPHILEYQDTLGHKTRFGTDTKYGQGICILWKGKSWKEILLFD